MATLASALSFARTQVQTDSNGLTDANGIIFANSALLDVRRAFIKAGVDASGVQEAYQDGTAGTGTYLYPSDKFFLKAIELNYSGGAADNYLTAGQVDVSNLPAWQSFSWLRINQSVQDPLFDDRGDWFEIFPTPTTASNLTQLMRIFYYLAPTEFTSTSDTVSYPESLDYRILGWGIAAYYLYSLMRVDEGDKFLAKAIGIIGDLKNTLGRGVQTPTQAVGLQIDGWQY